MKDKTAPLLFSIGEKVYYNNSTQQLSIIDKIEDISSSYLKTHNSYRYRTTYSKWISSGQWLSGYIEDLYGYITKIPTYPNNIMTHNEFIDRQKQVSKSRNLLIKLREINANLKLGKTNE